MKQSSPSHSYCCYFNIVIDLVAASAEVLVIVLLVGVVEVAAVVLVVVVATLVVELAVSMLLLYTCFCRSKCPVKSSLIIKIYRPVGSMHHAVCFSR